MLQANCTEVQTEAVGGGWVGGASLTCSVLPEDGAPQQAH